MANNMCKWKPTVVKRNKTEVQERESMLYKKLEEAVGDRKDALKMWAFTKTSTFKSKFPNAEYDDFGEVTFESFLKVFNLEDAYNEDKSIREAARDHKILGRVFKSPLEAISKMQEFNASEDKYVASIKKEGDGYAIEVGQKTGENIDIALEQSFRNSLSKEIRNFLRELGFDISVLENSKYDGMFDPNNPKFVDGFYAIIKIAKGERGEEALPEEFSHLIIEGLSHLPLVQRLLGTISTELAQEILGDQYEEYNKEYNGDITRIKKEVAGKMLAQHIKKEGTIQQSELAKRRGLLSRIWSWVKNLFSKIKRSDLDKLRESAYADIAGIYDKIVSREAVTLIDADSVLTAEEMYKLNKDYDSLQRLAASSEAVTAYLANRESEYMPEGRMSKDSANRVRWMQDTNSDEASTSANYFDVVASFLDDAYGRLRSLHIDTKKLLNKVKNEDIDITKISQLNDIAKVICQINEYLDTYKDLIGALVTLDMDDNWMEIKDTGFSQKKAQSLSIQARKCRAYMDKLETFKNSTQFNILYYMARTAYRGDKERGIGGQRNEIMKLSAIMEHATRDINIMDSLFSAMYDCDDALLSIMDSIVKNQKYERDLRMIDISAEINLLDAELRNAGYTSEFMLEKDSDGVPTGKIISPYDWEAYNKEYSEFCETLNEKGLTGRAYYKEVENWKAMKINKKPRLIPIYVDPELQERKERGEDVGPAPREWVPNPEVYGGKKDTINNLSDAQRKYYYAVMKKKREMMTLLPKRGQYIYHTINISKDLVEGIMDNSNGDMVKATKDFLKRRFIRRPDDIGFGITDDFKSTVKSILAKEKNPRKAAKTIRDELVKVMDSDVYAHIRLAKLIKAMDRSKNTDGEMDLDKAVEEIMEEITSENFYLIDTDFAGHRIQRLPVYYSRPLKDNRMLTTDFSGALIAYSAMAVNYEMMSQVVNLLELMKNHLSSRDAVEMEGNKPINARYRVLNKAYKRYVTKAGASTNIWKRYDAFMKSVVYEERTEELATLSIGDVNISMTKTLEALKDYTGILGLGLNIFSAMSNITVGKIQQWIEALGGEYFSVSDYAKAVKQYTELIWGCFMEMGSPLKKNKLSLLIQMFDPMGDYFESLRNVNHSSHKLARILGTGALGYIGMNAGEHLLHCQTMLAMLNAQKLYYLDEQGQEQEISLFDALTVEEDEKGISKLVLKEGCYTNQEKVNLEGSLESNPDFGKPYRDNNGNIIREKVNLKKGTNDYTKFLIWMKKRIRGVNASLNGEFSADDKGAAHRNAVWKLVLQFRQWMPAHYMRRFARAHYDSNMEQWREGYYITMGKLYNNMLKDIRRGRWEAMKAEKSKLSSHEKANMRRARSEIAMFYCLWGLIQIGGKVGDRDRNWWGKMALYQLNRMHLEIGSSTLCLSIIKNMLTILQSPAASIDSLNKFERILHVFKMFNEVQSGTYQGWSEWERDLFQLTPYLPQILKGYKFDDSLFQIYER